MEKEMKKETLNTAGLKKMNEEADAFIVALYRWQDEMQKVRDDFDGNDEGETAYDIQCASERVIHKVEEVQDLIFKLAGKVCLRSMEGDDVFGHSDEQKNA